MAEAPPPQEPPAPRRSPAVFWREHGVTIAGLALVLVGAALRLRVAAHEVSAPLIDENEVVEQAVAFMGGDLEQHFVKYGPLTMYVLAGVYRAVAAVRGLSVLDYAARVFFHGEEHYFLARALTALSLSALALVAFFQLRRSLGPRPALVTAALLGLPCVDVLVTGARIDMPQAAFQGLALLALGAAAVSGQRRAWLGAGVAAGLAIASKPLPGLLIAPCFPLASWFAVQHAGGEPRRWFVRLGMALALPGLWMAAAAALAATLIGDPALLDLREFVESQRAAVALHSSGPLSSGPSIVTSFGLLGLPLCALLLASFVLVLVGETRCYPKEPRRVSPNVEEGPSAGCPIGTGSTSPSPAQRGRGESGTNLGHEVPVKGDAPSRLVALFIAVYLAAFWGRSRHYFLVAAAVAACLLVGHGLATVERLLARRDERAGHWFRRVMPALALLLVLPPLWRVEQRTARPSAAREARDWIYANVPSGTRLYYVGSRGAGPPLVAHEAGAQAQFGEHFSYGREHYGFLKRAFERAYADYANSGAPRYAIAQHRSKPLPRSSKKMPRSITDGLLKTARAQKRQYIIVAGHEQPDVQGLGYTWFKQAVLEREFGKIAIFRVPDEGVARDAGGGVTGQTDAAAPGLAQGR